MSAVRYALPTDWFRYDPLQILGPLTDAKAAMIALREMPAQRSWAAKLQEIQLKREVAGTSRIEGAEFTEAELDAALAPTPVDLETRSQRQAAAALSTYQWIATIPGDRPLNRGLICEVHARLVTGCDDDHCPPGVLRGADQNVTFGSPRHRGVEGGRECEAALDALCRAVERGREHDAFILTLALHYHFAAMHPFIDGNGRTARVLEALMLQRLGLRDTLFIAMSNYYYEEKAGYLQALADTRAAGHDLTPFLRFALTGVATQCRRLFREIREQLAKVLYRSTMNDLFGRLMSPKKRVMTERHLALLDVLLEHGASLSVFELEARARRRYADVKNPQKALMRDLGYLTALGAIRVTDEKFVINLEWPTEITETEFFRRVRELPKTKLKPFLFR